MEKDVGLFGRLGDIVEDLVTLEINTIEKRNMTARKMPTPRHAIIDIAQDYCDILARHDPAFADRPISCDVATFDDIRSAAKGALDAYQAGHAQGTLTAEEQGARVLLLRVMRNSDQMKGMLQAIERRSRKGEISALTTPAGKPLDRAAINAEDLERLPITPEERILLRKIWEVGGEAVALQSTIQLDGDVLTRMRPKIEGETYRRLHDLHEESVKISLSMWQTLIKTAFTFLETFTGRIGGGPGR